MFDEVPDTAIEHIFRCFSAKPNHKDWAGRVPRNAVIDLNRCPGSLSRVSRIILPSPADLPRGVRFLAGEQGRIFI